MNVVRVVAHARTVGEMPIRRRAVLAILGWAGVAPAAPDLAQAGKRGRRRKRRRRRVRERRCQEACGASCATCRQRCTVCNEFQVCYHRPNSPQPLCKVALTPDACELCGMDANCDAGSVCVTGRTFGGRTAKISKCTYAFGVCMEEFP
jgi:hypothetical protein